MVACFLSVSLTAVTLQKSCYRTVVNLFSLDLLIFYNSIARYEQICSILLYLSTLIVSGGAR